jgi:hypothetical protein
MQAVMRIPFHRSPMSGLCRAALFAVLVLGAMAPAFAAAAPAGAAPDLEARYQQERAACANGKSAEDRATCLREAAAAHDAARHGELDEPEDNYAANALARCAALPAADRDVCRHRMREGATEGSVSGGGIIREYREITLPPAAPRQESIPGGSSAAPSTTGKHEH